MAQFIIGKENMTQLNEEHFETTDKEERYQRQKIIHLEDKIKVLEKSVERLNKLMGNIIN